MTQVTTQDTPLAEVRNVSKSFGHTLALNNVDFKVMPGRTHALVGRNGAGKSTLVSIMTGLHSPDSGEVLFSGQPAPSVNDLPAWRQHVACVYQYSTVMKNLSVAENLLINRQNLHGKLISWRNVYQEAQKILDEWDIPVDVRMEAGLLDVENRQLVEIARSLSFGARFIILDEPTAMLDGKGITRLFERMRDLQKQGVTFMFISHHLSEVYEVCQDVTVYRDAKHIITSPVESLNQASMIEAMTGEKHATTEYQPRPIQETVTLDIKELTHAENRYQNLSLQVFQGEMVGIVGNGGCGKVGLAETLVGLQSASSGTMTINGNSYPQNDVAAAIESGIGFVPKDRHHEGFVPEMSIAENTSMTIWSHLSRLGILNHKKITQLTSEWIRHLDIKTFGTEQAVQGLSGGNQQKVVQARAMANQPKVLVMISPTAGVDIKSKATLLDYVMDKSEQDNTSVVIVSDELDDVRRCDRVLVMFNGKITHAFPIGWRDNDVIAAMEGFFSNEHYQYQY